MKSEFAGELVTKKLIVEEGAQISGKMQVTAKKGITDDAILEQIGDISRESVISVKGIIKESNRAPGGGRDKP